MAIDLLAARQFIYANARLLDRHRLAHALDDAGAEPVLQTLRAYQNPDGGFGHALEPDVRTPHSETTAALHGLEILAEIDALDDPMVADIGSWVAGVADPDGGVPFILPTSLDDPRGPWMVPSDGGCHLTFGLAGVLGAAGISNDWLTRATAWCWDKLTRADELTGYWVKFALDYLDATPEDDRARAAIASLRPLIRPDGTVPVPGGTEDEHLTLLTLSPRPDTRSRALFTDAQVTGDLDALEAGQQDDGGWTFDFAAWSPGQSAEWRGLVTLRALMTLSAHGRL